MWQWHRMFQRILPVWNFFQRTIEFSSVPNVLSLSLFGSGNVKKMKIQGFDSAALHLAVSEAMKKSHDHTTTAIMSHVKETTRLPKVSTTLKILNPRPYDFRSQQLKYWQQWTYKKQKAQWCLIICTKNISIDTEHLYSVTNHVCLL